MPLSDLSQATVALQRLLQFNIPRLDPSLAGLTISTLPPERVESGANLLSLYCYHLNPDVSNRFVTRFPGGPRPIANASLVLNLYYILTAHTVVGTEFNALAEQRLLGFAMKTFHDHPVIDDTTEIGNMLVLPEEIRGQSNSFTITQMLMTPGEALNFWANEGEITVKPSCYYEVSAAELAPDPPTRLPGIVTQIGPYVSPLSAPVLSASQSEIEVTPPPETGAPGQVLTASPARVGPPVPGAPMVNVLVLSGAGLAGGPGQRLILSHPFWASNFPGGRVAVDLALNAAVGWALDVADDRARVTLGADLRAQRADGSVINLALYPGLYTARWEIARPSPQPDDRSNAIAFAIRPHVTEVARDLPTGAVTLSLGGSWRLTRGLPPIDDPAVTPELDIQVAVDGVSYSRAADPMLPLAAGQYALSDHSLRYAPQPSANTPGAHSVRLVVEGVDAQPVWVIVL